MGMDFYRNGFDARAATAWNQRGSAGEPEGEPPADSRDWLILSVKWSKGGSEDLVWYRPNSKGYTTDLNQAGRYTREEARRIHDLETHGNTAAVPLVAALAANRTFRVVEAGEVVVEELVRAGKEAMAR